MQQGGGLAYNNLEALPQAMGSGLQLGLRAPRENAAHRSLASVAIVAATSLGGWVSRKSRESMMSSIRFQALGKRSVDCGASCDIWGPWIHMLEAHAHDPHAMSSLKTAYTLDGSIDNSCTYL